MRNQVEAYDGNKVVKLNFFFLVKFYFISYNSISEKPKKMNDNANSNIRVARYKITMQN